jgi:hypothetical protein
MKIILAAVSICVLSSLCMAQGRPSTTSMSCTQVARLVATQGSVVLSTGGFTYDRFVSTRGFCPRSTYSHAAIVATRDAAQCSIGFYCSSEPPLFGLD